MKTIILKNVMILTALAAITTLTSCVEENELDTIKDAQMCLNSATTTTAQSCVSKLASNTSEQAYQLKCAAYFIEEGFGTPSALIDAVSAAQGASCTGCSGSINILTQLSFSSTTQSAAAFNVCSNSGIAVYSQLSSLVQISTLANPAGTLSTAADFETAILSLPAATLGSVVSTAYASSCTGQSTTASDAALTTYCSELGAVVTATSDAVIGACLKEKLTGNNDAACTLF